MKKKTSKADEPTASVPTSMSKRKPLPQYILDMIIPPLDESKLSQEERAERERMRLKALEVKEWAKEQIKMLEAARNTPPSNGWRCKLQVG